jgi:hypothetical protein
LNIKWHPEARAEFDADIDWYDGREVGVGDRFEAGVPTSLAVDRACGQAFLDEILGLVDSQHRSIGGGLRGVQKRRSARRHPPALADRSTGRSTRGTVAR